MHAYIRRLVCMIRLRNKRKQAQGIGKQSDHVKEQKNGDINKDK